MNRIETLRLSEPLINTYIEMERDLMVKIAEQLGSGLGINSSTEWRIRKLAQLGALSRETIEIITDSIGVAPELLTDTLLKSAESTLDWLDISADEKHGLMQDIIAGNSQTPISANMLQALQNYESHARDKLNQVNTVMQFKADSSYVDAVNDVWEKWSREERREQAELANRQDYLNIINANTGSVITGTATKQEAVRQAILQLKEKGIPAFIDKSGREWSPQAYVSMVIRTTVNNVARETQFNYMREHGLDVMRISSHNNARALCAPFQGKLVSISNRSGFIEDINGKLHEYIPLSSTTYGEPAGLFGINCGHFGFPVREKAFFPAAPINTDEDNEELRQAIEERERKWTVRENEILSDMFEAAGDKEYADIYTKKAQQAAAELAAWRRMLTKSRGNDIIKAGGEEANKNFTQAKGGGKHYGTYNTLINQSDEQLIKSLNSFQRNVDEHIAKINNPALYISDWENKSVEYRRGIVRKWEKDLLCNREQLEIAAGILNERGVKNEY